MTVTQPATDESRLVEHDLERVEQRIIEAFSPPLAIDDVYTVLAAARAEFDASRVWQFVPLLVERTAREQLRAMVKAMRTDELE